MSNSTQNHTADLETAEQIAGFSASILWSPTLQDAYPTPEARAPLVRLFEAAMVEHDTANFLFYFSHEGPNEIEWRSRFDHDGHRILVVATLSVPYDGGPLVSPDLEELFAPFYVTYH